jgi:hypothetical protein
MDNDNPGMVNRGMGSHSEDVSVVRCPVGISASGIVIEAHVCGSDSVGIGKAVLWRVQCNLSRSRGNSEDIMVVRCPVRHLGIVCRDRSCMSEQWATIQRVDYVQTAVREYHVIHCADARSVLKYTTGIHHGPCRSTHDPG